MTWTAITTPTAPTWTPVTGFTGTTASATLSGMPLGLLLTLTQDQVTTVTLPFTWGAVTNSPTVWN